MVMIVVCDIVLFFFNRFAISSTRDVWAFSVAYTYCMFVFFCVMIDVNLSLESFVFGLLFISMYCLCLIGVNKFIVLIFVTSGVVIGFFFFTFGGLRIIFDEFFVLVIIVDLFFVFLNVFMIFFCVVFVFGFYMNFVLFVFVVFFIVFASSFVRRRFFFLLLLNISVNVFGF